MIKRALFAFVLICLSFVLYGELIPVSGYTSPYRVFDILEEENTLWVATWGGLVECDLESGEREIWHSFNSGLVGCHVTALESGSNGELYVGTSLNILDEDHNNYDVSGLHVRDSEGNWTVYTVNNSDLQSTDISALFEDTNGNLWVGTSSGGLAVISESGEWTIYSMTNSDLPSNYITEVFEDSEGLIWICCKSHYMGQTEVDGGIACYNGETIENLSEEMPNSTPSAMDVMGMCEAPDGTLWIASLYSDYFSYDGETFVQYEVPQIDSCGYSGPAVRSIACKNDGSLIMGTNSGVVTYDGENWEIYNNHNSEMGEYNINVIKVRENGSAWLGSTFWGVYLMENSQFITYEILSDDHSIQCWNISDIDCCEDGSVWICAADNMTNNGIGGISYLRDGEWGLVDYDQTTDFLYNDLYVVDNTIYCATGNDYDIGGVIAGDENDWDRYDVYTTMNEFPYCAADDVTVDGEGWIWAARNSCTGGICVFDGTHYEVLNSANSDLLTNFIYCIASDPNYPNVVWVGGAAGLQRIEHDVWFDFEEYNPGNTPMTSATVIDMCFDNTGTLWIATDNGVSSYDGSEWICWNDYLPEYLGSTEAVWDIYCDNENRVWCATYSGLACLMDGGSQIFTSEELYLPTRGIDEIAVDANNQLWIGTFCSGVYCYEIVNMTGSEEVVLESTAIDHSNFPNPFNPETSINFNLPEDSNVEVCIYDVKGRKIRTLADEDMQAGAQQLVWNGKDNANKTAASGVYFYRIITGSGSATGKMILMK